MLTITEIKMDVLCKECRKIITVGPYSMTPEPMDSVNLFALVMKLLPVGWAYVSRKNDSVLLCPECLKGEN